MNLRLRLALGWLLLAAGFGLAAPFVPLPGPGAVQPSESLAPPSGGHWFGTDLLGRDVLSRVIWGARRTLLMAVIAVCVSAGSGSALGLAAGYRGGAWDGWAMRAVEVALAMPQLLTALVVVSALGPGAWSVGLAVGLAGAASFARLARAAVLQVREQPYVQAAVALGMSPGEIIWRHVLRNIAPALAAFATIHFAWAVLNTSALTFLGFGGDPAVPDWGLMLNEGRAYLIAAPWVSTVPGLAITLTVLAVNALGAWAGRPQTSAL